MEPGERIELLGPHGAGKTTTIKCICGLVRPSSGSIRIDGVDALQRPRAALERIAAVLEGHRHVYWRLTPVEKLELFAGLQGRIASKARDEIERLIGLCGLNAARRLQSQTLSRGFPCANSAGRPPRVQVDGAPRPGPRPAGSLLTPPARPHAAGRPDPRVIR